MLLQTCLARPQCPHTEAITSGGDDDAAEPADGADGAAPVGKQKRGSYEEGAASASSCKAPAPAHGNQRHVQAPGYIEQRVLFRFLEFAIIGFVILTF